MGNPTDSAKSSVDRKQPGHDDSGMPETEHPTGNQTSLPQAANYPPSAPSGAGGSPGTQGVPLGHQQNAQSYPPQQTYPPAQNPQMNNPVYQQHPQQHPQQPGYAPAQPAYPQQTYPQMQPPSSPYLQQQPGYPTPGVPMQQVQPMYRPPPYQPPRPPGTNAWTTGLFDCMDDPNNALITFCVPCFTFGQIAEIIDEGQTTCSTSGIMYAAVSFFTALPCLISCGYRSKLRNKYDLIEAPAADWVTHVFCEVCALCQVYRELKNRGYDPAIGWHGNQMRHQMQQQQVQMAPPMNQNMTG
ncbi:protein PLANT CADMIUM RESISTANCE 6-like [Papaver somniferum]|uniref:protein PLANT CADMIUM RESISTANCE 6-like n=1 Tax=Papaver somniferum TaxID=3469 RepID=UPI000E704139|nr:protein PLANT CADMIUM RESISTANCE 6-like [Papaver somniferum]